MACKYIYKGHQFNSEVELDDFILEKLPYESKLGDLVFSMTPAQLNVSSKLSDIAKKSHKLQKKYKEMLDSGKIIYDEFGDPLLEDPPYIGVNKFLTGLKNSEGNLLFPEFIEEEYWSRRFSNWKIGEFTDAEVEEFEVTKGTPITDPELHKKMREQMTSKWQYQAKSGTAVHNVLQICFSKQKGIYNVTLDDNTILNLVNQNLDNKNKKYLTEDIIKQTIQYAKKLDTQLKERFGEEVAYYPEFMIAQDTNVINNGNPTTLMGIIDLLIVDKDGRSHILDYKTSIHAYPEFSDAKKLSYGYQLSTYQRMLDKSGLQMYDSQMLVAPIKLTNFRKSGDEYIFDGIDYPSSIDYIPSTRQFIWDNIDEFMPQPFHLTITTQDAMKTVSKMMEDWFPDFSSVRQVTREHLIEQLKRYKALDPDQNGIYTWKRSGESPITATSETEFVDKVLKYMLSLPAKRIRFTSDMKRAINEAIEHGIDNAEFPDPIITESQGSVKWIRDTLAPYCNGAWEVVSSNNVDGVNTELLESFGLIALKTKEGFGPKQIDFIRVSTNDLTYNYRKNLNKDDPKRSRIGLTGTWDDDIVEKSKSNSLMVEAVDGNIEMIETMLLINQMTGIEDYVIGSISVVNPVYANGLSLTNEELMYCWNALNKHSSVEVDKISSGKIRFANRYEKVQMLFDHIMSEAEAHDWKDGYQMIGKLKTSRSILDENVDATAEDKLKALKDLLKQLNSTYTKKNGTNTLDAIYSTQSELKSKEISLYNEILMAISNLKGVNFRQQLRDHDMFIENIDVWKNGWSGTYLDNPGNMDSETLNLVTSLVSEAYQNIRDEIQKEKVTIAKLVNDLKKEKQFGAIKENTFGNQTSLYENMYKFTENGDFVFVNPNTLQGAERKFLEYTLYKINKNRFNKTDEELQKMAENNDISYYRVPLARGSQDSVAATRGLFRALRDKLRYLQPNVAFQAAREKVEGIFNAEKDTDKQQSSQLLFNMTNMFDSGENEGRRLEKLQTMKKKNIPVERNLETLLYKHLFAYSSKNNIDGVFPMIKAAMIHITTQGVMQNHLFKDDIHYLSNYIRNKILNQSIIDPKLQGLANKLGLLKSAASKFTLAFSPVQAIYQPLQGLWTDISLMIRKPDGKESFTFKNFTKALKLVYSDLSHYSDKPTLCSALNELYGINDMDMNTYIDRISQAKKGIWNFDNFMFKFASRPDFYNRMTIFTAQMMADGCLDAHSINEKGELVYDWKKDKRFSKFAANPNLVTSDPEYNKQKSLYYTIATQFVHEHAKVVDPKTGKLVDFKVNMKEPMALPRAYTSKEAESMKSLGDDIYGYYSHEKKSLIMSTIAGSMWLQFKTYWSGKKNQYLQSGGVRLRGRWEQYEEHGQKYYYQVDKDGTVRYDKPPITEETSAPVMQWKGQWQEGIILTLHDMAKEMIHKRSFKEGWNSKWNNQDENLQLAYRNNIKQFGYDITMFMLGGCLLGALLADWLKDLKEDNVKNRDFAKGCAIAAANIAVMSIKNSFMDFNAIESIGGPIGSWTPFAFEYGSRNIKNIWNVAIGDEDFWDGVVKTSSVLKQIKPALDTIKPDMFRTEREGGTWTKS